uniref:Uncharacterized protein n=1 Tax=Arundo donax TaxID=35708 RepID=A0A0A9ARY9_ARUDO
MQFGLAQKIFHCAVLVQKAFQNSFEIQMLIAEKSCFDRVAESQYPTEVCECMGR